jgi:hypothetical protein
MSKRLAPYAIVCAAAIVYPLVALAGGSPHFPDRGECARPAQRNGEIEAVFARFRDRGLATAAYGRATKLGFEGLTVEADGCGYVKVVLDNVPSLAVGRELAAEAARVGFRVTLEQPSP